MEMESSLASSDKDDLMNGTTKMVNIESDEDEISEKEAKGNYYTLLL